MSKSRARGEDEEKSICKKKKALHAMEKEGTPAQKRRTVLMKTEPGPMSKAHE